MTSCVLAAASSVAGGRSEPVRPRVAAPFVYAAQKGGNVVSQFGSSPSGSGALRPLTPTAVTSGPVPVAVAVTPQGDNAYVIDEGSFSAPVNEISQYSISPATGKLTPKSPATVRTAGIPIWIAVAANGKSVYVADYGADAISQYSVSPATGKLIPKSPATVKAPGGPAAIAVGPSGRYAYVLSFTKHIVAQYRINPRTGGLGSKPVATVATLGLESVAIAPNGKSAYTTDPVDGKIWQYRVSPATGKLTPDSPASVNTGRGTHDIAFTPDGANAYVLTVANDTVAQYRINPVTGALSPKPVSTAGTVLHPEAVVMAPDGKNAYVTSENDGILSQFAISPATGKITPLSPATVTTRSGSLGLAVTPDADLSARVTAPAAVQHGQAFTYPIRIFNAGPSQAWQDVVTDHLPAGTAFRSVTVSGGHCSGPRVGTRGGTVKCHRGRLRVGVAWRIKIKVTAEASHRTIRDEVAVTSVTPDPRPGNNAAAATTKVSG